MKVGFVTRAYSADYQGGDRILDEKVRRILAANVVLKTLELQRDSTIKSVLRTLARRSHPALETYAQRKNAERIAAFANGCDALVISHEALLAPFLASGVTLPSCLLLHNLLSCARGSLGVRGLFRAAARRLERCAAERPATSLLLLSQREKEVLEAQGCDNVYSCPPGVREVFITKPSRIDSTKLILSGSTGWGLKKRDIARFWADFRATRLAIDVVSEKELADDGTLRFAIVPDRFQTGFKLKVLDLLCRNAIPIAFVNLAEDFPDDFKPVKSIRLIRNVSDLPCMIAAVRDDFAAVATEIEAYKQRAAAGMSWNRMGEVILHAILEAMDGASCQSGDGSTDDGFQ